MIKITVLNDNTPGRRFLSEHGLSFYIETPNNKVLLDAGPGNVFLENAKRLNISLENLDAVVLSHGHWDHGDGLEYLNGLPLITHPSAFLKRYHSDRSGSYVGLKLSRQEMETKFSLTLSVEPVKIGRDIWYLGEIPRRNSFEAKKTAFVTEQGQADFVPDDSGIAIHTKQGLVVISGCAHAGIVNTVEHAMKISGSENLLAVLGGFHLKKADDLTKQTIESLQNMNVKYVFPSHCTDLPALSQFYQTFGMNQIRTGDVLTFDN